MGFAVLSAILVCLLIGTAFLGAFVALDLSRPVAALFVLAIGALTLACSRSCARSSWPPWRTGRGSSASLSLS